MILVTGGTGALGSTLTRRLVSAGSEVRIYRRQTSSLDLLEGIAGSVRHAIGDVTDPVALEDAMTGVEEVYHAAAHIGFGGRREREILFRVNVDGTAAVVNAALRAGVRRFVHTSSMAAFGRPDRPEGLIDEESEWQRSRVNSTYAYTKYLSELEVRRGIAEGLDAVIVNPALIFGAGRAGENTRRIVDRIRTESLPASASGGTNVVDVEDVADGMIRAMRQGRAGERYFLGSENLRWREIIRILAEAFRVEPPRWTLPAAPAMALAYGSEAIALVLRTEPLITRETARSASRFYRYSNRKAVEELGCTFRPFSETAQRIARELTNAPR